MMDFEYAETLKQDFAVVGEFYRLRIQQQTFLCRRRAEIYRVTAEKGDDLSTPDAVAILMNPGSARLAEQLTGADFPETEHAGLLSLQQTRLQQNRLQQTRLQKLNPDNTQYQLMRLMREMGWRHLRLINLSDLCDANSQSFAQLFRLVGELDGTHPDSLLHPLRKREMQKLLKAGVRLVAWGSNAVLKNHAQLCLQQVRRCQGLALEYPWYRFASPYRKDQKLSWLQGMKDLLTANN
ncbi:MAG: hypothetical protein CMI13_03445 [Oleibacter sp.]|nr:hypothetical protein [Thalassolituus sp.]